MDVVELLKSHRTIRKFTDEPLDEGMLDEFLEAGFASATSSNTQTTTVIRVRDRSKRAKIAALAGGQQQVETAPVFLVWCADLQRSIKACEIGGGSFEAGMAEHFVIGTVDCAIAAQSVAVASESLGLGVCYIGGIRNDPGQMIELLELPEQVFPVFGMCIGRPAQEPLKRPRLPRSVTVMEDVYSDDAFADGIARYDETTEAYYRERNGKEGRTWTREMVARMGSESRPFMKAYLEGQGFIAR